MFKQLIHARIPTALTMACLLFGCQRLNPRFIENETSTEPFSTIQETTIPLRSQEPGRSESHPSSSQLASSTTRTPSTFTSIPSIQQPGTSATSLTTKDPVQSTPEPESGPGSTSEGSSSNTSGLSTSPTTTSSSSTTSSSTQNTTTQPAPPVCYGGPTYCHSMKYVQKNINGTITGFYPDHKDQDKRLTLQGSDGTLAQAFANGPAGLFMDHVKMKGGLLGSGKVSTGSNDFYAFDVTLRNVGCAPLNQDCVIALAGELALVVLPSKQAVACVGFHGGSEITRATIGVNLKGTFTVGCYADQNLVWAHVKGRQPETSPAGKDYRFRGYGEVKYQVGSVKAANLTASSWGDVGRMRYWTELNKMKSDLSQSGP